MTIRAERPGDEEAIRAIHLEAFDGSVEARLVDRLRAEEPDRYGPSLVAEIAETVVGHVLLTRVDVRGARANEVLSLAPLGVVPGHQRRGVGSALVQEGLRQADVPVVLVGDPRYYRRFGFEHAARIRSVFDTAGEDWMVWFPPGSDPEAFVGRVEHPAAFDEV